MNLTTPFDQSPHAIKFEWGPDGLKATLASTDVFVIVDVLSFTTCVSVAVENGAIVIPFAWRDDRAQIYTKQVGALLAGQRGEQGRFNLSPVSLRTLTVGDRLVLPSPNGSQLSTMADGISTIAGCFRNAAASAHTAMKLGKRVTVIAAGERWAETDSLRPALEDALAAGAILTGLEGDKSPEAVAMEAVFRSNERRIVELVHDCGSARELHERGFHEDVRIASEFNACHVSAKLQNGCYERSDI